MKTIAIKLSEAEYKGIVKYLKAISNEIRPVIRKKDVTDWVQNSVDSTLQSSRNAVSDYIHK